MIIYNKYIESKLVGDIKVDYIQLENPKEEKDEELEKISKKQKSVTQQVMMKRITRELLIGKESAEYQAAIIGDQVGDPMKAAAGPAISVLMRMLCMIALVFGEFFASVVIFKII